MAILTLNLINLKTFLKNIWKFCEIFCKNLGKKIIKFCLVKEKLHTILCTCTIITDIGVAWKIKLGGARACKIKLGGQRRKKVI